MRRTGTRWRSAGRMKGEQRTLTYSELKERSDALARGLLKSGMNKGDRIMILLPRVPEAYIAYMAALKAGLIVLPCSEMLMPSDIRYRMTHAEVKGVIADGALTGRVDEAAKEYAGLALRVVRGEKKGNWEPMESLAVSDDSVALPRVRSDDIAFISYTSGTTGGPKGVIHHHSWAIAHQAVAAKIGWASGRRTRFGRRPVRDGPNGCGAPSSPLWARGRRDWFTMAGLIRRNTFP